MTNLKDTITQVHAEAGGMLDIYVFTPEQVDELLAAALVGDAKALRLIGLISSTAARIYGAPREAPALCLNCPRPAQRWGTVCLIVPHRNDATAAIGAGLCARCAALADLNARIRIALKEIWPTARVSAGPEAVQ